MTKNRWIKFGVKTFAYRETDEILKASFTFKPGNRFDTDRSERKTWTHKPRIGDMCHQACGWHL